MDFLTHHLTTVAFCWRLERTDGVAIGLTDHDRDLVIDGLVHRATPGMTPSAVALSDALDADTMEVAGALDTRAITDRDLAEGRWDGARATLIAVNWTDTDQRLVVAEGTIGTVETGEGIFRAELRGVAALLDRPVVEATAAECRAELGDRRCRVAMAGRRRFARIVAAEAAALTVDRAEPAGDAYGWGLVRWFDGANGGLVSAVARSAGDAVMLVDPPVHEPEPGALIELVEGCDKSLATCAARFGNAANFRGEPYLPGIDLLTRYPGA